VEDGVDEGQVVTGGDFFPDLFDWARGREVIHDWVGSEDGEDPLDAGGTGGAGGEAERVERSGGAERR
jgi:hypothetical protein